MLSPCVQFGIEDTVYVNAHVFVKGALLSNNNEANCDVIITTGTGSLCGVFREMSRR